MGRGRRGIIEDEVKFAEGSEENAKIDRPGGYQG